MKRTLQMAAGLALAAIMIGSYLVLGGPQTVRIAEAASLPGTATVSGTVESPQAFKAAQVYFRLPAKRMLYMVYTVGGKYQAMQLFPGDYEVSVNTKGLQSDVQKLTLKAGENATLNLALHEATAAEKKKNVEYLKYDEIYPKGAGLAVAEKTCIYCHGEDFLPSRQWTEKQWNSAIDYMTGEGNEQGAMIRPNEMSSAERADLVKYLVSNFGPDSRPRAVKLEIDRPVDEANLGRAEYIEYYFNVDAPGQGVNDPKYQPKGGGDVSGGRRMGQDPQLDPEGNVWVTDRGFPNRLVKLDPKTGKYTDYMMPEPMAALHDMNIDRYGVVWIPENEGVPKSHPKLWQFDPKTEKFTNSYPFDPQNVIAEGTLKHAHSISFDSKGNIYVGYILGGGISVFDRETKKMSTYMIPTPNSFPYGVVTDKHDKIWIAEFHGSKIAKFDPVTKEFTEYEPPTHPALIRRLTVGSDGETIWFGLFSAGMLDKLDPKTGKISEYKIPQQISEPYDFTPEGKYIWFSDAGQGGTLIRFDTQTEKFAYFPGPQTADMPKIRLTKEGAIWYSPRSSRDWPGLGVLYPDVTKITTLAALPAPRPW
jgi:streptogramin lyase/mono/diheme cytochrome c family protein